MDSFRIRFYLWISSFDAQKSPAYVFAILAAVRSSSASNIFRYMPSMSNICTKFTRMSLFGFSVAISVHFPFFVCYNGRQKEGMN